MLKAYAEHLFKILPEAAGNILNALDGPQYPSIRYNSRKPMATGFTGIPVSWEPRAVQLTDNPRFIHDPHWHAGAYYVQESSSMFLGHMVRQWMNNLAQSPLLALDLCAAPGGKSTQLLDILPDKALLVSNEVIPKRNAILRENLIRWGQPNIIITQNEPADFRPLENRFDLVLVDAPCSGEGLFRRDKNAIQEWSTEAVEHCSLRQRDILSEAIHLVKPGGLLIYSTCTFEPSENEAQVERLLKQGFELVPSADPFSEITEGQIPGTYRFYPHQTAGSGFFIACLKKVQDTGPLPATTPRQSKRTLSITPSGWDEASTWIKQANTYTVLQTPFAIHAFPRSWTDELLYLNQHLHITYFGCQLGELKKTLFIPAHALALSSMIRSDLPALDANPEEALKYLRKETIPMSEPGDNRSGWHVLRYEGLNLGWVKFLPGRINNYLPANWRILH